MALTADRWFTVIKLVETSGKSTTMRVEQSAPIDDAAARAASLALVTDLAAVTNCAIAAYYTYQEFVEDAFSLPSGAEIQNQALLQFSIDDEPTKTGTVRIPAPVDGIFAAASGPNYDVVDITDTDLIAFAANWLLDDLYYLSDGETADALLGGHRRHMKATNT